MAELIAVRLAAGETLTEICRTPGMPSRSSVHRWMLQNDSFRAEYARARAVGMEYLADEILTISDDDTGDRVDGEANHVAVQRARLQVDTRKFLMSKVARHIYGDRVEVEHSGSVDHTVSISDRERMRRLALFLAEDSAAGVLIEGSAERLPDLASPAPAGQPEPEPASLQPEPASPAAILQATATAQHETASPSCPLPLPDDDEPGAIDEPRERDDDF